MPLFLPWQVSQAAATARPELWTCSHFLPCSLSPELLPADLSAHCWSGHMPHCASTYLLFGMLDRNGRTTRQRRAGCWRPLLSQQCTRTEQHTPRALPQAFQATPASPLPTSRLGTPATAVEAVSEAEVKDEALPAYLEADLEATHNLVLVFSKFQCFWAFVHSLPAVSFASACQPAPLDFWSFCSLIVLPGRAS